MLSESTITYGNEIGRAYRGLDRLYRHSNTDDLWGIVVLDLGDSSDVCEFGGLREAHSAFSDLRRRASSLPEPDRRIYYADLTTSALTLVEWLRDEAATGLVRQISGFLRAEAVEAPQRELSHLEAALHDSLMAEGFHGDLRTAATAWEARHRVEPDDLHDETVALIDEATERTSRVLTTELPPKPAIEILDDAPFNARCDYARNVIEINRSPTISRPYLKRLVMHEVVPGHCLQFHTRARAYEEGWGAADALLSTVKCAASPTFEGLADSGGWLLGWTGPEDVTASLIYRYQTGLCTVAARGLHSEGWTRERAHEYLAERILVGGSGWISHRLAYIGARGRGAHIWSYWLGESCLRHALRDVGPGFSDATFGTLYGRLHSLASLDATDWRHRA